MKVLKVSLYSIISLIIIYILAGFFILPKVLKYQAEKLIEDKLYSKANIEKIEFNPLLLKLNIHNFLLDDLDGEKLLFFKELEVELGALKSIEQKHFRVEKVILDTLFLNIVQDKNGELNLAKLLRESSEKPENIDKNEANTKSDSEDDIAFLLAKIDLKNIDIDFKSFALDRDFSLNLRNLNYKIHDLGTFKNSLSSNNLRFTLNESTDIAIKGAFNLKPFKAYGEIKIDDLRPKELLDYEKNLFNFDLNKEANLNIILDYHFELNSSISLFLNSKKLELNSLNLIQNQKNIASLEKLDIKSFNFDLEKQEILLANIDIKNLNSNMLLDEKGINFANLINSSDEKNEVVEEKKDEKPWIVNLKNINANANFSFDDKINNSKTKVDNIVLNVKNIHIVDSKIDLNGTDLSTKNLSYIDNKNGLDLSSQSTKIAVDSMKIVDDKMSFSNINLDKNGFSFIEKRSKLSIKNQNLKSNFKNLEIKDDISVESSKLDFSNFTFNDNIQKLNIKLDKISTNLNGFLLDNKSNIKLKSANIKNPNLKFEDSINKLSLGVKNTNIDLNSLLFDNKSNLTISKIALQKPSIDLFDAQNSLKIVANSIKLNINSLKLKNSDLFLGDIKLINPSMNFVNLESNLKIDTKNIDLNLQKIISKPNFFKIEKSVLKDPHITIALAKSTNTQKNDEDKKVEDVNNIRNEEKSNFRFNLGPVDIKNLTLDFEDNNLNPPFKTTISKLNGAISELKSKQQNSELEINGVIDRYATAKITGTVNPNDVKILTDINMKIKNISMSSFTPYSAKFVGRNIDDGKLDLDLYYNILESNLKAKNSIVIKKLKLGKSVESPDAISLPLDLAITLLEDSSNVIDLNLPISGNIDDPEFSVASIVWKAFVNLITKAITSPFSLISSLFNFDENDIKSVDFELKEYEVTPLQEEVLDKISQILESKDELAVNFTKAFVYEKEDIKVAEMRENSIKEYLEKEKSISSKQIIFSKETKSTSSNFDVKIVPIK